MRVAASLRTRLYTNETDTACSEVLAASQVGRAIYRAERHSHRTGEYAGRTYTFAAVILVFNNAKDGFGRKSMSECSSPCDMDCPAGITALLSPVEEIPEPGSAADWHARVAAAVAKRREATAAARRFRPGQRLHLTEPLGFQKSRVIATEFEVVPTPVGRCGPIFRPVGQNFLCRLPTRLLAVAMVDPALSSVVPTQAVQLALLP